ncbi:hypothetical protein [Paenibacillus tundrae]|uniref:Succinylarginine dihydrolase n=1 Tax=Paenibacillus tundrae TaxID=528187 RepID=A0ABT9W631_9BACL|nr:hypothetical protein [Paenibacillus tundrae]MDQ0168702.1 succinylarginine dihydrolase [Paenibacillus tundrae]
MSSDAMFTNFRRTFHPTLEERRRAEAFLARIEREESDYFRSHGFNDTDIEIIRAIESEETSQLSRFQSYSSRWSLLTNGIITIDNVRNDIKRRINGNEQRTNIRNNRRYHRILS